MKPPLGPSVPMDIRLLPARYSLSLPDAHLHWAAPGACKKLDHVSPLFSSISPGYDGGFARGLHWICTIFSRRAKDVAMENHYFRIHFAPFLVPFNSMSTSRLSS